MKALAFLRDWALIFSMCAGVLAYLVYDAFDPSPHVRVIAGECVAALQPALIFAMLFLTFCRVNPKRMRLCRWHLWLLLIQCSLFSLIAGILVLLPSTHERVILEGAMICLICPTATAAAVITRKLGGSIVHVTTYTLLINLAASILIPLLLPYVHPQAGMSAFTASMLIMSKVFPLLLFPLIGAFLLRYLLPNLRTVLARLQDAPFYLWVVSLALAIAVTTRSIVHSTVPLSTELWLVAVSLVCCVFQFWAGRKIGGIYADKVSAGQALGQKNTVLAIWLGYTFFTPITSIVGGFYSIWHNVVNSYQLYKHRIQHNN